jgi:hypothetical protein
MSKISWQCECGKTLKAERNAGGYPFTCPRCRKRGKIPKSMPDNPEPATTGLKPDWSIHDLPPRVELPSPIADEFEADEDANVAELREPLKMTPSPSRSPAFAGVVSTAPTSVEKRYATLRQMVKSMYGTARAILILGALIGLGFIVFGLFQKDIPILVGSIAIALIVVLVAYAVSNSIKAKAEMIMVAIDTEENTRLTCLLIQRHEAFTNRY